MREFGERVLKSWNYYRMKRERLTVFAGFSGGVSLARVADHFGRNSKIVNYSGGFSSISLISVRLERIKTPIKKKIKNLARVWFKEI